MKSIQTVFSKDNTLEGHVFDGSGQQAATDALQTFPGQVVKLEGHVIDGEFKKADMSLHWERTQLKKEANAKPIN